MMQGFYMLALRQYKRRRDVALIACAAALVCSVFAARVYFTAAPAMAETAPPYVATSEDGRLVVTRAGKTVIRTEIDVRTLPEADRNALAQGKILSDADALARLLEDYGS